jgi:hypothetical protein
VATVNLTVKHLLTTGGELSVKRPVLRKVRTPRMQQGFFANLSTKYDQEKPLMLPQKK